MSTHHVADGEWMGVIASEGGHREWRSVWNHAKNAGLRAMRDPNLLVAGDRVWIPDVEAKEESGGTGKRYTYRMKREEAKLVVRVVGVRTYIDLFGAIPYRIKVGPHEKKGEVTKEDDLIEVPLPISVREGTLWFGTLESRLMIGGLTPVTYVSGIQARVSNLGWDAGPVDNDYGPLTKRGVRDFQACYGIEVDGIIDAELRGKAREVYGC